MDLHPYKATDRFQDESIQTYGGKKAHVHFYE